MIIEDIKPKFYSIEESQKESYDQGYSFDEAGLSFDEVDVAFGGIYGIDGNRPMILINDIKPM